MRGVAGRKDLDVEWRLFSLGTINAAEGDDDPLLDPNAKGTTALRTLALVRREVGNDAVGRLYESVGTRIHDRKEPVEGPTFRAALEDAGLDLALVDRAMADDSTAADVRRDHDAAIDDVGAFGVPTIVLESGKGMFGPVLTTPPRGADADELWERVRWLIELDGFYEIKRERDRGPGE
jgi:2-hydroxychromene-2-carboxylate isomerase